MPGSSPAVNRQRKVLFIDNPDVAYFLKDSAPSVIWIMVAPRPVALLDSTQSDMRCGSRPSCLKKKQKSACALPPRDIQPPEISAHYRPPVVHQSSYMHEAQDEAPHLQWHLVRERFWWRKEKKRASCSRSPIDPMLSPILRERTRGRCFNCLARDHRLAQCRDPPTCWCCGGSGHISSRCKCKASTARLPFAQALMERGLEGRLSFRRNSEGHSVARQSWEHATKARDHVIGYPRNPQSRPRVVDPSRGGHARVFRHHPRHGDKDGGWDRPHIKETLHRQCWFDRRDKDKGQTPESDHGWHNYKSSNWSNVRNRSPSPPPTRINSSPDERRAWRMLSQSKGRGSQNWASMSEARTTNFCDSSSYAASQPMDEHVLLPFQHAESVIPNCSDAIQIIPQENIQYQLHEQSDGEAESEHKNGGLHMRASDAIVIPLADSLSMPLTERETQRSTTKPPDNCNVKHTSTSPGKHEAISSKGDYSSANSCSQNLNLHLHAIDAMVHTQLPLLDQNTVQHETCPVPDMPSTQNLVSTLSPAMARSEAQQLFGHELIEALRNFKQIERAPLSSSILHDPSPYKEAATVRKKCILCCRPRLKNKIKPQRSVTKFTQEALAKKWHITGKSIKPLVKLLEVAEMKKKKKFISSEISPTKKVVKKKKKEKAALGKTKKENSGKRNPKMCKKVRKKKIQGVVA